jgi:hypothetical protein
MLRRLNHANRAATHGLGAPLMSTIQIEDVTDDLQGERDPQLAIALPFGPFPPSDVDEAAERSGDDHPREVIDYAPRRWFQVWRTPLWWVELIHGE